METIIEFLIFCLTLFPFFYQTFISFSPTFMAHLLCYLKQKLTMVKVEKNIKEDKNRLMQMAVDLSQYALDSKSGGPFGAID